LTTYPTATHYSENVTRAEGDCRRSSGCGCTTPPAIVAELVLTAHQFEQARIFNGNVPMTIDDMYRCPKENAFVGGKPNSAHMRGFAIDFGAPAATVEAVNTLAANLAKVGAFDKGGIGTYYRSKGWFVHADRWHDPAYRPARWSEG
jgi:hypothetical protein